MSCPVAIGTGGIAGNLSIENRTRHAAIMLRLIALAQAILVDSNLEMPQKRRGVLNFVDDHRWWIGLEQLVGRGARGLRVRREIKSQVGCARIEMSQQRRLADLSCTGDEHSGKLPRHPPNERVDLPCNPYEDNMHSS